MSIVLNSYISFPAMASGPSYVDEAYGVSTITIPATSANLDLGLLLTVGDTGGAPSGWTFVASGNPVGFTSIYASTRVLNGSDPGSTVTLDSGQKAALVILRGVSVVTFKGTNINNPGTSVNVGGFVKDAAHKGIITVSMASAGTPSNPTGFTNITAQTGNSGTVNALFRPGYLLDGSYVNNTTLTFTTTTSANIGGIAFELT